MRQLQPVIEVDQVVVRYRGGRTLAGRRGSVEAASGVSLQVAARELVALVGESGSGKTTIARAIVRLVGISEGAIRFRGRDTATFRGRDLRRFRGDAQLIFQDPYESLDPRFTVKQTIEEPLRAQPSASSEPERHEKVVEVLELVGLSPPSDFIDRRPHELSGGQRQRIAIAAGLVTHPRLIVADEPVSMLDVSIRAGILNLLREIQRDQELSILMITHDLATAVHVADRIVVMYRGRIVEEGTPEDIVRNPQHPYTRALLAALPVSRQPDDRVARTPGADRPQDSPVPGCSFQARCPIATPVCATVVPPLRPVRGSAAHSSACLLADFEAS